jgi:hypothetical protein
MTARDGSTRSNNPRRTRGERLKDEVYRHMFRLEASRPGPTWISQSRRCACGSPRIQGVEASQCVSG